MTIAATAAMTKGTTSSRKAVLASDFIKQMISKTNRSPKHAPDHSMTASVGNDKESTQL